MEIEKKKRRKEKVAQERPARGGSRTAVDGGRTTLVLVFCHPDDLGVVPSKTRTTPSDWTTGSTGTIPLKLVVGEEVV